MDKAKYNGGGYFTGAPARDMTLEEWARVPKELRKTALKQGLYTIVTCEEEAEAVKSATREKKPCEVDKNA